MPPTSIFNFIEKNTISILHRKKVYKKYISYNVKNNENAKTVLKKLRD